MHIQYFNLTVEVKCCSGAARRRMKRTCGNAPAGSLVRQTDRQHSMRTPEIQVAELSCRRLLQCKPMPSQHSHK